jgi:hypothetical protein
VEHSEGRYSAFVAREALCDESIFSIFASVASLVLRSSGGLDVWWEPTTEHERVLNKDVKSLGNWFASRAVARRWPGAMDRLGHLIGGSSFHSFCSTRGDPARERSTAENNRRLRTAAVSSSLVGLRMVAFRPETLSSSVIAPAARV